VSVTLRGLWRWRAVALAIRRAGMSVQSGTVPVERLWASMQEMFPDGGRNMSLEWYTVLALLFFLRFNFRHFHHKLLPTWTENDARLAVTLENMVTAARAMQEAGGKVDKFPQQLPKDILAFVGMSTGGNMFSMETNIVGNHGMGRHLLCLSGR
jgi:hypothetical protein